MKYLKKWLFLLVYFIPYCYISIICDIFAGRITNTLIGAIIITTLGYISIFIPMFVLKLYKNKFSGFLFIIFGNLINSCISIISILLFFDYKEYDYYFKPFGTIGLSVFLSIMTLICQIIRYVLINLSKENIESLKVGDSWSNSLYLLYLVPIYSKIIKIIENPNYFIEYFLILIPFLVILLYKDKKIKKLDGIFYIIAGNIVSLLISNIFLFNIYIYKEFLQIFYMVISFIVLTWLQILVFIKVNKY